MYFHISQACWVPVKNPMNHPLISVTCLFSHFNSSAQPELWIMMGVVDIIHQHSRWFINLNSEKVAVFGRLQKITDCEPWTTSADAKALRQTCKLKTTSLPFTFTRSGPENSRQCFHRLLVLLLSIKLNAPCWVQRTVGNAFTDC